ncbi:hypothetical protein [Microbulbifer variabilis]|uniref:hypothetical protein n=1 Tax=Microbulbifer variabilis TaxID=266805 RepID=UPI00037E93BC|nr:hypothetical protein [Microbulbifer variabilis]
MKYIFSALFVFATVVQAAEIKTTSGTINKIQFMSMDLTSYSASVGENAKSIALIHMDALPASCGNANGFQRVAITSDHPSYNSVVSGALAAKASGQTVEMRYFEECTLWSNSAWDFAILTVR